MKNIKRRKHVRLKDVLTTIDAWESGCKERGQIAVYTANFASLGSKDERDNRLRCVVGGSPKDVAKMLERTAEGVDEKRKLIIALSEAIRVSLSAIPASVVDPLAPFPIAHGVSDRARFRGPNQALGFQYDANHPETDKEVFLSAHPAAMWLRIMPASNPGKTWPDHEIRKHMIERGQLLMPFSNEAAGYRQLRSADGVGIYSCKPQSEGATSIETGSVAFVFNTGEIWSVDTSILMHDGDWLPYMEDVFAENLLDYASFLDTLGIKPPYKWMVGITGTRGRRYDYPVKPKDYASVDQGPLCADDYIIYEGEYDGVSDVYEVLLPFFEKIFDQFGLERPAHLDYISSSPYSRSIYGWKAGKRLPK